MVKCSQQTNIPRRYRYGSSRFYHKCAPPKRVSSYARRARHHPDTPSREKISPFHRPRNPLLPRHRGERAEARDRCFSTTVSGQAIVPPSGRMSMPHVAKLVAGIRMHRQKGLSRSTSSDNSAKSITPWMLASDEPSRADSSRERKPSAQRRSTIMLLRVFLAR